MQSRDRRAGHWRRESELLRRTQFVARLSTVYVRFVGQGKARVRKMGKTGWESEYGPWQVDQGRSLHKETCWVTHKFVQSRPNCLKTCVLEKWCKSVKFRGVFFYPGKGMGKRIIFYVNVINLPTMRDVPGLWETQPTCHSKFSSNVTPSRKLSPNSPSHIHIVMPPCESLLWHLPRCLAYN